MARSAELMPRKLAIDSALVLRFAYDRRTIFGLPVLPLIIGVILGPRIERQLRQSLQLGGGDWSSLFTEPVAIVTYVLMAILLLTPLVLKLMHRSEEGLLVVEDDADQKEKAAHS